MSEKQINTQCHIVDFLSVSAAETPNFGPVAMITVRHDPGNNRPHVDSLKQGAMPGAFAPHNLALTVDQARRLRDDLNFLFENVDIFEEAEVVEPEDEEPKPKRRRRRRGRKPKGE
jgi:hypothetical protein